LRLPRAEFDAAACAYKAQRVTSLPRVLKHLGEINMRALLLAIALGSASPVIAAERLDVPAEVVGTQGFVYVAYPKGNGEPLWVRPVGGSDDIRIDQTAAAAPLSGAQAFGAWLPAGKYRITGWGVFEWKDGPEFDVQAGRVTDLGAYTTVNVGGYQVVLVPIRHAEHEGGVAAATADFAGLLKDPSPLSLDIKSVSPAFKLRQPPSGMGLITDLLLAYSQKVNKPSTLEALKQTKDATEFLRLVRTFTLPLQDEPAQLPDTTLFFPADFGQLRKRSPGGEWTSVGMDTLRSILAVEYADGRLVAGADDGRIRESRDAGQSWRMLKEFGRKESVLDIDHGDGTWVVTTVEAFADSNASRGKGLIVAAKGTPSQHVRVYTGRQPDLTDLALSKDFVLAPKDQIGWMGARGQLADGRYYLMAGTSVQRLDLASGQWSTLTPGPRISSLRVNAQTGVLTAMWSQGAFSKVYVSNDRGDTWKQIGRPPYIIADVQMDTMESGWASRWNMNAFSGVWETYAFNPAKADWDKSGEAPFNCRMMRVATDMPVLCFTPDAAILALRDGKWSAEFAP
jgi:hypothetical protein